MEVFLSAPLKLTRGITSPFRRRVAASATATSAPVAASLPNPLLSSGRLATQLSDLEKRLRAGLDSAVEAVERGAAQAARIRAGVELAVDAVERKAVQTAGAAANVTECRIAQAPDTSIPVASEGHTMQGQTSEGQAAPVQPMVVQEPWFPTDQAPLVTPTPVVRRIARSGGASGHFAVAKPIASSLNDWEGE